MSPEILIVDDDPDMAALLQAALQGYPCKHARDGETALAMLQSEQPSLIILDIMMDGIHGLTVLQSLRSNPKTANIPVVVCSNIKEETVLERARKLGIADYIAKPFNIAEVSQRLKKIVGGG